MAKQKLGVQITANDRKYMRTLNRVKSATMRVAKVLSGIVIAAGIFSVKQALAFGKGMAEVNTLANLGADEFARLKKQVLGVSAELGLGLEESVKGVYDAISAGIPADNVIDFLRVAGKSAIAGASDVATTVDALTSVINAYGMEAKDAGHISDVLFQVVKDGKITMSEIGEQIGKLAPTANAAGMSLETMGAVVAALVKVEKPERAFTALRTAMMWAADQGMDLLEVVRKFEGADLKELTKAGITQRAAAGIAILANNIKTVDQELINFQDTAENTERAASIMMDEPSRKLAIMLATLKAMSVEIGDSMLPKLTEATAALGVWAENQSNVEAIATAFGGIAAAIIAAGYAMGKLIEGVKWITEHTLIPLGTGIATGLGAMGLAKEDSIVGRERAAGRGVSGEQGAAMQRLRAVGINVANMPIAEANRAVAAEVKRLTRIVDERLPTGTSGAITHAGGHLVR